MTWSNFSRLLGKSSVRFGGLSLLGAASISTYYMSNERRNGFLFQRARTSAAALGSGPFGYPVSREIRSTTDSSNLRLTLFQYQTCPFCCKVRAYLDYRGISYDVVEVNSVFRTQVKWSEYKKVPILVIGGPGRDSTEAEQNVSTSFIQMNDSSVIISALETYFEHGKRQPLETILDYYPSFDFKDDRTGRKKIDFQNKHSVMFHQELAKDVSDVRMREKKWRKWVDEHFVHLLAPNIYRTMSEAVEAFNYVSDAGEWERLFPTWERLVVIYVGATAMYFIGKMLKRRYELKDDVRESLFDGCATWAKAIGRGPFMGGERPDLSDLAVYGVLSSIEGCSAFRDAMQKSGKLRAWFQRMREQCRNHVGMDRLTC